jgi:autotransporter translocation and assembly factor TamB
VRPDEHRRQDASIDIRRVWLRWERFERKVGPISLPGARIQGDRAVFPQVRLETPGLSLSGDVAAILDGPLHGSLDVAVDLTQWGTLGDAVRFDAVVDVGVELFGTTSTPRLGGSVSVDPWHMTLASSGFEKRYRFGGFESSWDWRPGEPLSLTAFEMQWAEGLITGSGRFVPSSYDIEVELSGRQLHIEPILRDLSSAPTPWVHLLADVDVVASGGLSPFLLEGEFQAQAHDLAIFDEPAETASSAPVFATPRVDLIGQLSWDQEEVRISKMDATLARSTLVTDLSIGVAAPHPLRADVQILGFDLSEAAPLRGLELDGRLFGDLVLDGPLRRPVITVDAEIGGLALFGKGIADHVALQMICTDLNTLSFESFRAKKQRSRYQGRLDVVLDDPLTLDLQVLAEELWIADATSGFVDLPQIDGKMTGTLSLNGPPDALSGEVEAEIEQATVFGEPFVAGTARATMREGHFTLTELLLTRADSDAVVLGRGSIGPGYVTNVEFVTDGWQLQDLAPVVASRWPVAGAVVGDLTLGGTLMDLTFEGRVSTGPTRFGGGEIGASTLRFFPEGSQTMFDGQLLGQTVALGGRYDWEDGGYRIDAKSTQLPVHWLLPQLTAGDSVRGAVTGELALWGGPELAPEFNLDVSAIELVWGPHALVNTQPWRITRSGGRVTLEGVQLADEDGYLSVTGGASEGELDVAVEGRVALDWLEAMSPDVTRATGLAALTGTVRGPLLDPQVQFDLEIERGVFRTTYFPHTFEEVEARVSLSEEGYVWTGGLARVGGGQFATRGRIDATDWVPRFFDIDAELTDGEVQYLDWLPPVRGNARLEFGGAVGELLLSGEIEVVQVVFADRVDWEQWVLEVRDERLDVVAPEESAEYFAMDIGIVADETGRVRNNVADSRLAGELRVVGTTARPGLTGIVRTLSGGRGYLKNREFEIRRGEVRFIDPYTFDPEMDFLLETEVTDGSRDWRVSYVVTGPFSDWQISARSDPPLPEADINALLLFGVTSESLTGGSGVNGVGLDNVVMLVGEAGAPILVEWLVGGLLTGVDRWDVVTGPSMRGSRSTGSSPRLLVEKDVDRWDVTFTGEINVVDPADTYLGLEKRLAERLYLTTYWLGEEGADTPVTGDIGLEFKFRWEVD